MNLPDSKGPSDPREPTTSEADNPFVVSALFQGSASKTKLSVPPPNWFRVDGKLLICGPQVTLPPVCVETVIDDDNLKPDTVAVVYPSLKLVLVARVCHVNFYRSRSARRRNWLRLQIGFLIFGLGLFLIFAAGGIFNETSAFAAAMGGLVSLAVGLVIVSRRRPKLYLAHYKAPGIHSVKGFSDTYLAYLDSLPVASRYDWESLDDQSSDRPSPNAEPAQ